MSENQIMRPVAMCDDGRLIGIETVYTVVDGKQINIPGKVEAVRALGKNKRLFCPCGCGVNLYLSASPENLKKQHFRKFPGQAERDCHYKKESAESVNSKIVLKCWMDDKLKTNDVEDKRAICKVDDESDRKFQFTLLSPSKKIAVSYCRKDFNLSDEKIKVLQSNKSDISTVYVVDAKNGSCEDQYPEYLMKVQKIQKFCLLLTIDEFRYERARLESVFYAKDENGLWKRITLTNGLLKNYGIADDGDVLYCGESVLDLYKNARHRHDERLRKIAEEKRLAEEERKRLAKEEAQRRKEERIAKEKERERLRLQREAEKKAEEERKAAKRKQEEEAARLRAIEREKKEKETAKQRAIEVAKRAEEEKIKNEKMHELFLQKFEQQEVQVRDELGRRWVKCEYCGKIATESEFVDYGGRNHVNLGTCRYCMYNNPQVKEDINKMRYGNK